MSSTAVSIVTSILWGTSVAGIAWCSLQATSHITYVTLADGQRSVRRLPFLIRILLPFAPNLAPVFETVAFEEHRRRVDRKLVSAGMEEIVTPGDFLSLRVLTTVVIGMVLMGLFWYGTSYVPGRIGTALTARRWIFAVLGFFLGLFYMPSWLNHEVNMRHKSMHRALPFVLDLLTLSVEAGMDFMSGLQRIVDRQGVDPLGEELIRVLREIQLGKTRREALKDMSHRVNQPDVRSVTSALIQADEMGVSIGSILRIQADQMRIRRFQRAEKLAHEAPVKMLFPLIAFIFPAVFLVLLGPVFLEMARNWF